MNDTVEIDLPLHMAMTAPEPDLNTIYAHVQRLTGETREVISADLFNGHDRSVNVHGTVFYENRSATFVVELESDYEVAHYGWEVTTYVTLPDGSLYLSNDGTPYGGRIEYLRLD